MDISFNTDGNRRDELILKVDIRHFFFNALNRGYALMNGASDRCFTHCRCSSIFQDSRGLYNMSPRAAYWTAIIKSEHVKFLFQDYNQLFELPPYFQA
jgi:hypothetical protein